MRFPPILFKDQEILLIVNRESIIVTLCRDGDLSDASEQTLHKQLPSRVVVRPHQSLPCFRRIVVDLSRRACAVTVDSKVRTGQLSRLVWPHLPQSVIWFRALNSRRLCSAGVLPQLLQSQAKPRDGAQRTVRLVA